MTHHVTRTSSRRSNLYTTHPLTQRTRSHCSHLSASYTACCVLSMLRCVCHHEGSINCSAHTTPTRRSVSVYWRASGVDRGDCPAFSRFASSGWVRSIKCRGTRQNKKSDGCCGWSSACSVVVVVVVVVIGVGRVVSASSTGAGRQEQCERVAQCSAFTTSRSCQTGHRPGSAVRAPRGLQP